MRHLRSLPLAATVLLSACQVEPPAVGSTAVAQARGEATSDDPLPQGTAPGDPARGAPAVPLEQAMPYARARAALLRAGWTPLVSHACPPSTSLCRQLPELDSCHARASCLMRFTKDGQTLDVRTFGDLSRWDRESAAPRATVDTWGSGGHR